MSLGAFSPYQDGILAKLLGRGQIRFFAEFFATNFLFEFGHYGLPCTIEVPDDISIRAAIDGPYRFAAGQSISPEGDIDFLCAAAIFQAVSALKFVTYYDMEEGVPSALSGIAGMVDTAIAFKIALQIAHSTEIFAHPQHTADLGQWRDEYFESEKDLIIAARRKTWVQVDVARRFKSICGLGNRLSMDDRTPPKT